MLTSEQVLDILPYAVDIFDKLDIEGYAAKNKIQIPQNISKEKAAEIQKKTGVMIIKYILKSAPKAKEEIFSLVAVLQGTTADEVRKQSFFKTAAQLKEVLSDKEIMDFFTTAMQSDGKKA
jgi:hypothetical protein